MRAGNSYHRVKFYAKVITRDIYGASSDTWPIATISTRGEVRYTGGYKTLANEEKFYAKSVELIVRFQADIVETMKIQIDGTNDLWSITFMEILGRFESLRLTIEKCADGLPSVTTLPPTALTATAISSTRVDLAWTNNAANDGVVIETSTNGNTWTELTRIAKATIPVITYSNIGLITATRYFYRVRAFNYNNYSTYTTIAYATTS